MQKQNKITRFLLFSLIAVCVFCVDIFFAWSYIRPGKTKKTLTMWEVFIWQVWTSGYPSIFRQWLI